MPKASLKKVLGVGSWDRVMTSMMEREYRRSTASNMSVWARSAREVMRPLRRSAETA